MLLFVVNRETCTLLFLILAHFFFCRLLRFAARRTSYGHTLWMRVSWSAFQSRFSFSHIFSSINYRFSFDTLLTVYLCNVYSFMYVCVCFFCQWFLPFNTFVWTRRALKENIFIFFFLFVCRCVLVVDNRSFFILLPIAACAVCNSILLAV